MGIIYKPKLTQDSLNDFKKLDGSQKKQILKSLTKIEQHGLNVGQQLHGKLRDCRKLKHKKMGLRVIFKLSEQRDSLKPEVEIVEIVVIGRSKCYENNTNQSSAQQCSNGKGSRSPQTGARGSHREHCVAKKRREPTH